MHSKWQTWDFYKNLRTHIVGGRALLGIQVFNPYIEIIIKDEVKKFEPSLKTVFAKSLTVEWLENEINGLSLFGNSDSYIIQNAHELSKECIEFLENSAISLEDRRLIFMSSESLSKCTKFIENGDGELYEIQAPKFWEMRKIFDFLCQYFGLSLAHKAESYILDSTPEAIDSYYAVIGQLKLIYPDKSQIEVNDLHGIIKKDKLDKFEFANLISRKKFTEFYEKLLGMDLDFTNWRSLFSFIQSHFLKLMDPSYIDKKSRPSKYDREIQSLRPMWAQDEIVKVIEDMLEFEIYCKMKDDNIKQILRSKLLQTY